MKVNISNANSPLDQKTYERYAKRNDTVNLRDTPTNKQLKQRRVERIQLKTVRSMILGALPSFIAFMVIAVVSLFPSSSEAFFWDNEEKVETPIEAIIDREEYCNNYLIRADYDKYLVDCKEYHKVTKDILDDEQGFYTTIKWGKYNQPVQVFDTRVNYMIEQGYSLTEIIDLNTLLTMECPKYS